MVVLSVGNNITPKDLPEKVLGEVPPENQLSVEKPEFGLSPAEMLQNGLKRSFFIGLPEGRGLITEALEKTNWVKNKAAGLLELNRTTLVEKIKKMNLKR